MCAHVQNQGVVKRGAFAATAFLLSPIDGLQEAKSEFGVAPYNSDRWLSTSTCFLSEPTISTQLPLHLIPKTIKVNVPTPHAVTTCMKQIQYGKPTRGSTLKRYSHHVHTIKTINTIKKKNKNNMCLIM